MDSMHYLALPLVAVAVVAAVGAVAVAGAVAVPF
jgi:hypothetical protein